MLRDVKGGYGRLREVKGRQRPFARAKSWGATYRWHPLHLPVMHPALPEREPQTRAMRGGGEPPGVATYDHVGGRQTHRPHQRLRPQKITQRKRPGREGEAQAIQARPSQPVLLVHRRLPGVRPHNPTSHHSVQQYPTMGHDTHR